MQHVQSTDGQRMEPLGLERWYNGSLRQLKLDTNPQVAIVKDFDTSTEQIATYTSIAAKCSFADYDTGKPNEVLIAVLNEMASRGLLKSWYMEPARIQIVQSPLSLPGAAFDGWLVFAMCHMLGNDVVQHKSEYPFLLNEGEPLVSWTVERKRLK